MRNLIILGNGFDLAHGLKTRYSDFRDFIWNNDRNFYEQLTKYIFEDDLWNDFENALGSFDDGGVKEMSEAAYLNYDDNYYNYDRAISDELKFSSQISEYLSKWIKSINTKTKPIISRKIINNENIFINFNYTDTLEKVYGILNEHILYIHGNALSDERLIIGHHNVFAYAGKEPLLLTCQEMDEWIEYRMNMSREESEKENQIGEYFVDTYKDTDEIIARNKTFFDTINDVKKIFILGHSLAYIDFSYFQKIRESVSEDCVWNITYHSEKDENNAKDFVKKLSIRDYQIIKFEVCFI